MSIDAMKWVFDNSPYKGTRRLIHLIIADVVNPMAQNHFWAANETVAQRAACSRQYVNTALGEMVADGYLKVVKEGKPTTGKGHTVKYEFIFPESVNSDEQSVNFSEVEGQQSVNFSEQSATTVDTNPIEPKNDVTTQSETLAPSEPEATGTGDWRIVWDAYLATLERCGFQAKKLNKSREDLIRRRLKDWSKEELILAINGLEFSDYHRGKNDSGKVYNSIELILRSAEKIEQFQGYNEKRKTPAQERKRVNDSWVDPAVPRFKKAEVIGGDDDPF